MGKMEVRVKYETGPFRFLSAGVTRTARLIARGEVMVPEGIL
jgi:4-oxalomesaconate tautomerase